MGGPLCLGLVHGRHSAGEDSCKWTPENPAPCADARAGTSLPALHDSGGSAEGPEVQDVPGSPDVKGLLVNASSRHC